MTRPLALGDARGAARSIRLIAAAPCVLARVAGPPQPGRVHSAFARAVNLQWADGALTTLQPAGPLVAPFAAALAALPRDLAPGAPAWIGAGELRAGHVTITGAGAAAVATTLGAARVDPGVLREALRARPPAAPGLDGPGARAAQARIAAALAARDLGELVAGAAGLIGLGEGLTPAGDDWLVGALGAAHALAPAWTAAWPRAEVRALAAMAATRTTTIAAAFLTHALRGELSAPLLAVLGAPALPAARAAVARLAGLGATSGADTLDGLARATAALAA